MEETNKEEAKECLDERIIKEVETSMEDILEEGLSPDNLEMLSELVDIHKDIINERKEIYDMNYGNYNGYGNNYGNYGEYNGRGPGHGSYGEYNRGYGEYNDGYNARGRDSKYRGYGHLDRMYNDYGRYMESRERYGANENTKTSLKYMLESMEDFARMLKEEAQSQEEVQMIRETAQRIAQM